MICASLSASTTEELVEQIKHVQGNTQFIELRLDGLVEVNITKIKALISDVKLPVIFTLRKKTQGGNYTGEEADRLAAIKMLAGLSPSYFDIEEDVPPEFTQQLRQNYPNLKLIVSHHHFGHTPENLDAILFDMRRHTADWYKVAFYAQNSIDMLRLMNWAQKYSDVIAVSMGENGQPGRLLGPVVGSPLTYGRANTQTAPGQLAVDTMVAQYRLANCSKETKLFGLIGDPVSKSVSDYTHNQLFHSSGLDALYVKMVVKPLELCEVFRNIRQLPFTGLSVTMPLKEVVIPYLDSVDAKAQAIGAVNTIRFVEGKAVGYNTDCDGALNALESVTKVKNKRVVIIGAGGAARAIAYEARIRGATVCIVNRDAAKAAHLADLFTCSYKALSDMAKCASEGYDILINTTPIEMPIEQEHLLPSTTVMDIQTGIYMPSLLKHALTKNCLIVHGYRMFVEQAVGQFDLWYGGRLDRVQVQKQLDNYTLQCLRKH